VKLPHVFARVKLPILPHGHLCAEAFPFLTPGSGTAACDRQTQPNRWYSRYEEAVVEKSKKTLVITATVLRNISQVPCQAL
jgi:hypothetical protein